MKSLSLLIVSDTRMQKCANGVFAFNSVVNELDVFLSIFNKVTWVGFDYSDFPVDATLLKVRDPRIEFVFLRRSGGLGIVNRINILFSLPGYFISILKQSLRADVVHVRGPSVPMLIALLISFFIRKKLWWFKYANNWSDSNPPFFWSLQQIMMRNFKWTIGTINGCWPDTPKHILSFENPCFKDIDNLNKRLVERNGNYKKRLLFVGRIEVKKGIASILSALQQIPLDQLENLTIIGDGCDVVLLKQFILDFKYPDLIHYIGPQNKDQVFEFMKKADFLLLPSLASEGFPKVIAESWYNGCIPVVSDVSSVSQYVKSGLNGIVWYTKSEESFSNCLSGVLKTDGSEMEKLIINGYSMCHLFTYSRYEKRIKNEILFKC